MSWEGYAKLEVSGAMLKPGFCIYLMEIRHANERLFYLGMTGDPNYPSARAAFHRLSGHLELTHHSTQNQLKLAFDEKGIAIENCHVVMHHFPIKGFKPWTRTTTMRWEELKKHFDTPEYHDYKKHQRQVLRLEKALIAHYSQQLGKQLLNRTSGKQDDSSLLDYEAMRKQIDHIIQ